MTRNQPSSAYDGLMTLVRWAVALWLGWIALVTLVALCQAHPLIGSFVTSALVVAVLTFLWLRFTRRRAARSHALAAYRAAKHRQHVRDRVHRAQVHPEIVFEDNVAAWEREMQSSE